MSERWRRRYQKPRNESKNTLIRPQSRACAVFVVVVGGEQSSIALKRNIALENLEEGEITRRLPLKMEATFFDARRDDYDDVIIIA